MSATKYDLTPYLEKPEYSARFRSFMPFLLEWETVFSKGKWGNYDFAIVENEPGDGGSWTKFGIDITGHPKMTVNQIKNLTLSQAIKIYWEEWAANGIEKMENKLGNCYFNACINCGVSRADKILAKAKNAAAYLNEQEDFYLRLIEHKPKLAKFKKGWLNRTAALRRFLNV